MTATGSPWDEEYRRRGRLYGGSAPPVPPLPPSARVLEIGCGDGRTASSLAGRGYIVTAIDSSRTAILLCRSLCTEPGRLRLCTADGLCAPFRDRSFDVITASHIAGHLARDQRRQLAGEILRLLAGGGIFFFCDFSTRDFRFGRGEETEPGTFLRKNGIATHYFTDDEVQGLLAGFGIRALRHRSWDLRIRGSIVQRDEIVASCEKPV